MKSNPASLEPLAAPIQYLKGFGPARATALEKQGVKTVRDLLFYVPRRYLDRSSIVTVEELRRRSMEFSTTRDTQQANVRQDYTVVGEVRSFKVIGFRSKARLVLILGDETGTMQCVWFGGVQYWKNKFQIGETLAVSGQPSFFGGVLQFVHPELDRIGGADQETSSENGGVDWSKTLHTGGLVP
ncbi:MAG: hypothetical protein HY708_04115, partial [Ignavibacteriae bacterium]|nr:hypothetical protein [Ignavibacteriota bacterium]